MFKFLAAILAGYILFRLLSNEIKKRKKISPDAPDGAGANYSDAREMVADPVCGVYVSPELSPSVRDGDKIYYFCSYECRDKFLENQNAPNFTSHQDS